MMEWILVTNQFTIRIICISFIKNSKQKNPMDFETRPFKSKFKKNKYLTRLFSVFQHQFSLVHSFFGLTSDTEFARVLKK